MTTNKPLCLAWIIMVSIAIGKLITIEEYIPIMFAVLGVVAPIKAILESS